MRARGLHLLVVVVLAVPLSLSAVPSTQPALPGDSGDRDRPAVVFVKLDYEPVARYGGGVRGLAPTSPSVTGRPLSKNPADVGTYTRHVAEVERTAVRAIRAAVPTARVVYRYRTAYGGLAVRLPRGAVSDLARLPEVVAVQRAQLVNPDTEVTPQFLGAAEVWPAIGGPVTAASNVIVGVIDTGIWPEHPSFADLGLPPVAGTRGCEFGDGSPPALGDPFDCTDKLIGAYAFTDAYLGLIPASAGEFCDNATDTCSARDADGHGTHTASTAAGNAFRRASIFGVDRGRVSGMAPGARVIAYRACLEQGCFTPDLVASVEQAIEDGADVINYSISGGTAYDDPVEQAFLDAYAAGISVNASAGNSGPAPGTVNHVSPWVTTVGAATSPRHFVTTLHLEASNGDALDVDGVSITGGLADPAPLVKASSLPGGDDLCSQRLPSGSATGRLVLCRRGGDIARVVKGFNVMRGGAAGMVLYNPQPQDVETDNHWLPAVHLDFPAAEEVLDFLASHASVEGSFGPGEATAVVPDVVAAFSSRGSGGGDFIKPDVIGPGVQILAGRSPDPAYLHSGPPGDLYQAIAGTSMSGPHVAGLAALVMAAHPAWTPGQVKSALMTSAATGAVKEDGVTPADPFDQGAGSARADRAVDPTMTFDVPAATYASTIGNPVARLDLNLPSIDVPAMPGIGSTTRRGTNVSSRTQTFDAVTTAPSGATITVTPAHFAVEPGNSRSFTVEIDGSGLPDGQHFGEILLDAADPAATDVRLPVAFRRQQGPVRLEHSCVDTSLGTGQATTCTARVTNTTGGEATFSLRVEAEPGLAISDVSAPGVPEGNGFRASGKLFPVTAPLVRRLEPGGHRFVDLPSLGVRPLRAMDDEDIVNVGTPRFLFGRQPYRAIGVVSNGYVVIGGAGENQVAFRPQPFPNPALPNNVVAPFWTDLDPSAGGSVFAAKLLIGDVRWVVVQWRRVPTFRTSELQNFQVWIRAGDTEGVSFVYAKVTGDGGPRGLGVGAENSAGTSGANLGRVPKAGESFRVITSGPLGGQSRTFTYRLTAQAPGRHHVVARMTSPLVRGVTVVDVPVDVD